MPGTVRTSRSLLCQPGTVPIAATAATQPLSLSRRRRRRLHSIHAHLRVTTLRLHSITSTPGDGAACSRMPTVISLTHSDLTHAVFLTLGRSITRAVSLTHSIPLTHAEALTRSVSFTQGGSHTRAVSLAHAAPLTRGASFTQTVSLTHTASFTHGALGSTHPDTLVTTPLTHGVSSIHGVSFTLGVSSRHGVALTLGVSLTPFTTHTGTFTLGIHAPTRAPGASIPPKLLVHPFAALASSTPLGTTEPTWS